MPKVFTSKTQKIGEIGENIAEKFLVKHNFIILERNYTKKWGEIDIIAKKENKLYFIEVKSVSRETKEMDIKNQINNKKEDGEYRPEDNMHPWKLKRLSRTIQTYLLSKKEYDNTEWQVDLLVVYLDLKNRNARVRVVKDIIL
ncbi:YraN family protein [Candidatus Nomurabacteria bacterium]|nr:YraN family protein [Candidatus Nomurabacteria bacterium]